jgi:polyhydroxyalkanoate synthesis repressor PhaR
MNEFLIKKYPNRRLYDIERGVYVTLKDLRQLVQGDRSIKIIDANTEVDITRAVLLQVLSEEEQDSAFLTAEHLRRILRLYGREDTARMHMILDNALSEIEKTTSLRAVVD